VADCEEVTRALLDRDHADPPLSPSVEAHIRDCPRCTERRARIEDVDAAMATLAAEAEAASPPPDFRFIERRARAVARGRRRRRALRRLLPLALAFTSAVGVTATVVRATRRAAAPAARSGAIVDASRGVAEATLADGAHLTVTSGRAVVALSERHRALVRLDAGTAFLSVPHLDESATFVVGTEEAEVRVRGTRFEVARSVQGTRIEVADGTVEVRPRAGAGAPFLLAKGESRLVEGLAARRERARLAALAALDQRDDSTAGDKIAAWLDTAPPAEEAAHAHALLAWKLSRDGDAGGAREHYRQALALLPAGLSPLWADNASAQLALLVERDDPAAARQPWRAYLERFPSGVHAALARSRLADAPGRTAP
jgi:ferric-dicitrate binding protein FerR (iron transport regulator)